MKTYLAKACPRQEDLFSFGWHFFLGELADSRLASEELEDFRPVQLPHDWSVEYPFDEQAPTYGSGGYVRAGIGWYKKVFVVDAAARGKRVSLHFDGSYMLSTVWLNGTELGTHVYGYTPFSFDITDIVRFGEKNIITVKVDNASQPNSRWFTGSGITRDVWLRATDALHVKTFGSYITTPVVQAESATVSVKTTIVNEGTDGRAALVTKILGPDGECVAENTVNVDIPFAQEVNQLIRVPAPRLWDVCTPVLYTAKSEIVRAGCVIDTYETRFGIRTIEFDPQKGFFLNGERVKINGFCAHHDGGSVGAAVPRQIWERRLKTMKAMGANSLRCAHNPPDPAVLDLCDELGILVMDEAFDEWRALKSKALGSNTHESRGYSEWFETHHEEDTRAMLYRDRNHPSIIIWSIGNEVPEQTIPDGHLIAQKLKDICREVDPTRPITQACDNIVAEPRPARQEFLDTLDLVGYNYVGRWRTRAETLYDDDRRANPGWCMIGTENPSLYGMRGTYLFDPPQEGNFRRRQYFAPYPVVSKLLHFTMTHDYVAGDYMWTGIDYLGESHWPGRSSSSGLIDTCGFEKDGYYFFQSIWRRDVPMVHACPHWTLPNVEPGRVIPVLCFTNCEATELILNGKSYGKKSYSYPAYGMTERYSHFDKMPKAAITNDLYLAWDVPYEPGVLEVVGYNDGAEAVRKRYVTAGAPAQIALEAYESAIKADGRGVAQITVRLLDAEGNFAPQATDVPLHFAVDGPGRLIGLDNGRPDSHELFGDDKRLSFCGMAFAIVQSTGEAGEIRLTVSAEGYAPQVIAITAE